MVAICGQQQALLSGDRRSRTDLVALDSQLIVTSSPAAKGTAVTTVIASSAGTNRVRESEWQAVDADAKPYLLQYNDPFTAPWARRNEVAIPVKRA